MGRIRTSCDLAELARGDAVINFASSFVYFMVRGHEHTRTQRMTMASAAAFSGGGREDGVVMLCEELLGGRAHDTKQLIATPTYSYKMVISEKSNAIYREYMPPKSSGNDDFCANDELFEDYWFTLDARRARRLTDEVAVGQAVNSGLIVNGLAQMTFPDSGRVCSVQFPIRYFSVKLEDKARYHAEAGPILIPSKWLGESDSEAPESMCIAQIGFNRWDEGEIAIWSAERAEYAASRWFSRIRKFPAEFSFLVQDGNQAVVPANAVAATEPVVESVGHSRTAKARTERSQRTEFGAYFAERPIEDRFLQEPEKGMDVIIPILHANELWRSNLLSIYREVPVNRLLLGDGGCIDDSMAVAAEFPRVEILDHRSLTSLGFSVRRLIEEVKTEFFCYFHSDVYLPQGWFDAMYNARTRFDWYESGQNTLIMVKTVSATLEAARAYSGSQMGRKAAFENVLPKIDDDYLYRNEDIIFANLLKEEGFRYGKVAETVCDHQQIFKESPWLRRVRRVDFELELGKDEEIRAAMTYVKGIVKYLKPEKSADLIGSLHQNLAKLVELGALAPTEFPGWVAEVNPAWTPIFPMDGSPGTLPEKVVQSRLKRAPATAFRRASRLFDRIATQLTPKED